MVLGVTSVVSFCSVTMEPGMVLSFRLWINLSWPNGPLLSLRLSNSKEHAKDHHRGTPPLRFNVKTRSGIQRKRQEVTLPPWPEKGGWIAGNDERPCSNYCKPLQRDLNLFAETPLDEHPIPEFENR